MMLNLTKLQRLVLIDVIGDQLTSMKDYLNDGTCDDYPTEKKDIQEDVEELEAVFAELNDYQEDL